MFAVRTLTLLMIAAHACHAHRASGALASSRRLAGRAALSRAAVRAEADLLDSARALASTAGVVAAKGLDTFEDAVLHLRRMAAVPAEASVAVGLRDDDGDRRRRIVVIGAGWGAHALIKVIDASAFRVTIVSPRDHFLFTPMLAATAVGTVEYRSIVESMRASNPLVEFVEGVATDIDPRGQRVSVSLSPLLDIPPARARDELELDAKAHVADGARGDELRAQRQIISLPYDTLVVACGARVSLSAVPGAALRCHRLKEVEDARELRRAISEAFARAARTGTADGEVRRLLTFVVVGGGPTGVELSGEMTDLLSSDARRLYPALASRARVVLVHGGAELLPPFEPSLRAAAASGLRARGVQLVLNSRVERVGETTLTVRTRVRGADGAEGVERSELPYGAVVWCAGTTPQPFVRALLAELPEAAASRDGRLNVDSWLRVRMGGGTADARAEPPGGAAPLLGSILAIGDAACETFASDDSQTARSALARSYGEREGGGGARGAAEPTPLPQTAQVAAQQGAFAARMINRGYTLASTPPVLADARAGGDGAPGAGGARWWLVARGVGRAPPFAFLNLGILAFIGGGEALAQVQLGDVTLLKEAGSVGFLLWRSVYLVKQVALRNRVLVTFDWLKAAVFGRDLTRF
ncbi:hypothetical protein KFE25_003519 [Diacronema lutheri]|uniref:FAD/NAD(P)-binding domain-containing protein n=1 Tax=Diacronema lutheri TaxID=2081491 RepID=A0A8J5X9T3_DIALT|nr:hypothetical protein KFE25_003519 [Diacronema lutheri]